MPELEQALLDLAPTLEWPAEPDLAPRVLDRLPAARPAPRFRIRRDLVLALAVGLVVIGALFAVPGTRAAILELFHLRGVTIERVDTLPAVPVQGGLGTFLGTPVSLDEARRRAGFDLVVPAALGDPDGVYFQESPPGGMVSFLYGTRADPTALFTQFAASVDEVIYKKVAPGSTIRPVMVDGHRGYWLRGAHYFTYFDRERNMRTEQVRLAGNVLLWELGTRTMRLEADVSESEALRIAESAE
jgi:hypothetical protein